MIIDSKIKGFLKKEIPDVDYGLHKEKLMSRICDYETKRERQGFYFMPKIGMSLIVILLMLNIYSLVEEALFGLQAHGKAVYEILSLPFFSPRFIMKVLASLGDNALLLLVNITLIFVLNRRFLGLHRIYRLIKNQAVFLKNMALKLPSLAFSMMRIRRL